MKILVTFPPLDTSKGFATLGQNRQFQYFKEPTFIYPVVPAQAATLLKREGFEVVWLDCIAEGISLEQFFDKVKEEKPDIAAIEAKTPVIKQEWRIINALKSKNPGIKVVLFGDHVTALPEESFKNSAVDFVLTGGDYDFLLMNLCKYLELNQAQGTRHKAQDTRPQTETVKLEAGIYYREGSGVKNTGKFLLNNDLNSLPDIDRELTEWKLYAFKNGNYKRTPGTYIMSGRDCWWGKCTFCSWPALYPHFRTRHVDSVLDEIGSLIRDHAVREVMDDTGCFPAGGWLKRFCEGMIERGFNKKIYFDCNMRFGALTSEEFRLMKKANFRLLLFGLESANQNTLDRINKDLKVERIIEDCRKARRAGLFPHITVMFGYPWESLDEAQKTLRLAKWLLRKGLAYTMQSTVVIPYPGSPLFKECREKGWLRSEDWDDYDMKAPVMRANIPDEKIMKLVQSLYSVSFHPEFILRRMISMRDLEDFGYALRAGRKVIGHILDFKRHRIP